MASQLSPFLFVEFQAKKYLLLWVIDSLRTRLNHVLGKNISIGLVDTFLRLDSRHERAQPK